MIDRITVTARWDRLIEEALDEAAIFAWNRSGKHDSDWPNLTEIQRERFVERLRNEFWIAFHERFEMTDAE